MGADARIVFDPHVGAAIFCLVLAVMAAVLAFALGLPDQRKPPPMGPDDHGK
jgi:hypothetical protein